jgi:hypothetical protein
VSKKKDRIPAVLTRNPDGQLVTTFCYDASSYSIWHSAVRAADEVNNPAMLYYLLLNKEEPLRVGQALILDLLDRHQPLPGAETLPRRRPWSFQQRMQLAELLAHHPLKKKRGRQADPIYQKSEIDARLDLAAAEVRAYQQAGSRHPELIRRVAELHGLDERALQTELSGKRGSTSRKAARRDKYLKTSD